MPSSCAFADRAGMSNNSGISRFMEGMIFLLFSGP